MRATSFPNGSSFITGISRRAWGTAKSIDYGNGVSENTEFNERMQATEYELEDLWLWDNPTYADRATFDYYDDGRMSHSFYATGVTKFDRKFELIDKKGVLDPEGDPSCSSSV